MTTPLTINELERRLRFAAPDEPLELPALVLPTRPGAVRSPSVRLRGNASRQRDMRLVYALIALLLALAVAIAAGAVRLLREDTTPLTACDPNVGGLDGCLPVAVPDGWVDLGSGQFQSGEFAEEGLGYAFVQQVLATQAFACPTPGGPFPVAVPSGDGQVVEVPLPTSDAGLACIRTAPLPDGAVRIVTIRGSRITGGDAQTGGILDLSEPTPDAGWTERVDGRPARLMVLPGAAGRPSETRIWDVLWPGSMSTVLRIQADIAGPDLAAGRAKAQAVVDAVDFQWDVPPLEGSAANRVLKLAIDQMDRGFRDSHSDLYACFPREPGSRAATIHGSDAGPLAKPLDVTCTSRIEPSLAGVWRITLDVAWTAGPDFAADTLRIQYFSTGQAYAMGGTGIDISGGETRSLSGRLPQWDEPGFSWFPNARHELPPPLTGPLELPAGTLARILYPGESIAAEPGPGDDSLYPGIVGTHVYVLDGPVVVDGDAWYRVQSGTGFPGDMGWIRGTRKGRPQLEAIEAECPAADGLTVGEVTWLINAERMLCFGDAELAIEHGVFGLEPGYANMECMAADGIIRPCPTPVGDWAWLGGSPSWSLFGVDGRDGPEPGLLVWLAPGVQAPHDGQAARVRGHFDDPAADGCRLIRNDGVPFGETDEQTKVLACRERFVITSIEPR